MLLFLVSNRLRGCIYIGFNPQALQISEEVRKWTIPLNQKSEQAEIAIDKYTKRTTTRASRYVSDTK